MCTKLQLFWYGDMPFQECSPLLGSSDMCVGKLANRMVSHDFGDFRCSSDSRATFGDVIAVRPRPASPVTLLLNLQRALS